MSPLDPIPGQRIGIDARSLAQGPAGIATYVRNLLEHLPWLERLEKPSPSNNLLWNMTRPPAAQLRRRWSLYHAPTYTLPLVNFCKTVLMVADVSYLVNEDWYPHPSGPFRRWYYRASLFRADRIIVPSDFTASELARLFPSLEPRIRRIHLAVSDRFRRDEDLARRAREEFGLPERFVLHVGDIHPRRNIAQLAEASRRIGLPLVLVGKVLRGGEPFADHPFRYEGLTLDQLIGVYSAASVLGYPSSYEGFGFPLLEAMACQLPVVASNQSCLPEIAGQGALLVSAEAGPLAEALEFALSNREEWVKRGLRRARDFSWGKAAETTVDVYRELIV